MPIKYLNIFVLIFLSIVMNLRAAQVYELPSYDFEFEGRRITIMGCSHGAYLEHAIPNAKDLVSLYTSIYIEHELQNTVLDFLASKSPLDLKAQQGGFKYQAYEGSLIQLQKSQSDLIKGFDIDSSQTLRQSFNFADMQDWKLWIAHLFLQNELMLRVIGETGGVELQMARLFRTHGKKVAYLETTNEIFNILDKDTLSFSKTDFDEVMKALTNPNDYKYAKERLSSRLNLSKENAVKQPRIKPPKSVSDRNRLWLDKIRAIAQSTDPADEKCLIIVGYGHLAGIFGLIRLMSNDSLLKTWVPKEAK